MWSFSGSRPQVSKEPSDNACGVRSDEGGAGTTGFWKTRGPARLGRHALSKCSRKIGCGSSSSLCIRCHFVSGRGALSTFGGVGTSKDTNGIRMPSASSTALLGFDLLADSSACCFASSLLSSATALSTRPAKSLLDEGGSAKLLAMPACIDAHELSNAKQLLSSSLAAFKASTCSEVSAIFADKRCNTGVCSEAGTSGCSAIGTGAGRGTSLQPSSGTPFSRNAFRNAMAH
mmetsp:Transcript_60224/g.111651  ORF Transcript_60224/g.111651 Transcript_60224/m.111651 type:complete len:232 (+) Transcript_60224:137-832(+)